MRILMVNASPHKGNTWIAMCEVRDAILQITSDIEFEEVHMSELNLPFCVGCSLCFRKGMSFCPHYDIMKSLFHKMEHSDGLILGATTFNMAPNAIGKNFIDHLCFLMHRPHFFKNKAIVVSTTGGVFANKTVAYMEGTLLSIGFNRCYKLPLTTSSWNDYNVSDKDKCKIKKEALRFYKDIASGKLHAPKIGVLIPYNLFRGMSLGYVKGTEYETEDGNHWTDERRSKSAYDITIKVPIYKKLIGHFFYLIGKKASTLTTVTYKK